MKKERRMRGRAVVLTLMAAVIAMVAIGRAFASSPHPVDSSRAATEPFATYREIPGVTAEEIAAIDALHLSNRTFNYGMTLSTEAFFTKGGEVGGYSALLCRWLTDLFGVPFVPAIYERSNFVSALESGEIDFTGDLTITDERKRDHFMTGSIAERLLKAFRVEGAHTVSDIAKSRPPRLVFTRGFAPFDDVKKLADYAFEPIFVKNYGEAYGSIKSGEADAYLTMNIAELAMDVHGGGVVSETFYPLIFASAGLFTQKSELAPVISVVQKALSNGGASYLADLYTLGYRDYVKHSLLARLTPEELEYIKRNPVVKIVTEFDSYPLSFYNKNDKELQGIAFDIMRELTLITGLSFEVVNPTNAGFRDLTAMVERGEASMITAAMRSKEREKIFLLPAATIMTEYPLLISKSEFHNVQLNELSSVTVGIVTGTLYTELFKRWFPNNKVYKEYGTMDGAFDALARGDVDMFMCMSNYLLSITNYKELAGYKANVVFDNNFDVTFGINKGDTVLYSIIDKALRLIDIETISKYWVRKSYDYRAKMAEARLPWIVGAAIMALAVLSLALILFYRSRDLRKQMEAEAKVREANARAHIMFDVAPYACCMYDKIGDMIDCNQEIVRLFGIPDKDYYFKRGADLSPEYQPCGTSSNEMADRNGALAVQNGSHRFEWTHRRFSGELFSADVTLMRVNYNGELALAGYIRDLTEQKAVERLTKEAMEAYAAAESALEAKNLFVANMNHEMRTPMNVIVGLTDLLLEEEGINADVKEMLHKINTAGTTLMGLISDVLDISKVDAGKMELMPVQYDVASFLNDIVTLNVIRIEDKPIVFNLDISEHLPRTLNGDDLRVKQILNNLLSNAFKYTKAGSVTLSVDCKRDGDIVWVSFRVTDTGIGIRAQDIGKLFNDYHQVDARANRRIVGTGLGLSITKRFVEIMGGEISAESEYGKGTTFSVRIKQEYVSDETIGKENAENLRAFRYLDKKAQVHKKFVRADLSYARALVVDDFQTNLDVAAGMLRKYKMQVDCVTNGQASIDLIAAGAPIYSAIFMDHMMPEMDGIEAAQAIRALGGEYAKSIPIIALTANAVAGNEQMFLDNGFDAFLPKPFNVMTLDSVIQRFVRDKARE